MLIITMNFYQNTCMIFFSVQLFYLFHLPGIVSHKSENKKLDKPTKVSKFATLPLVLLKEKGKYEYSFPRCFRRSSDGTLVDFKATNEKKETVYFCPKSLKDRLLFPMVGSNYDTCDTPPKPTLLKETGENYCGENKNLYRYGYKLFKPKDEKEIESFSWKEIYSFCYDRVTQQISYLRYRIHSPNLLKNRQLQNIRSYFETVFRLEETQDEYLDAYGSLIMSAPTTPELHKNFAVTELGHPADMVFPNWKKPFYYAGNQGLMLHQLKHQWRKIGYFVRKLAEKKLGEIEILTGTAEFPNKNFFGTFWKLVIYKKQAIAIILHNIYEERSEEKTNVDDHQPSEKHTNANDKLLPRKKQIETTPFKIPIKELSRTTRNEVNVADNSFKKESNMADEPIKKDTETNNEVKSSMHKFCEDICDDMGFGGIISHELMYPAYCCEPAIIAEQLHLNLPDEYEVLNLRKTPRDRSVTDDDCPKHPLSNSHD